MNPTIETNLDLYDFVQGLRERFDGVRDLESYLRALWQLVVRRGAAPPTATEVCALLEAAFSADVPEFDPAWSVLASPFDDESEEVNFETWQSIALFLIADIRRMREAGAYDDPHRGMGLPSATGVTWYNFEPLGFLECGVRGAFVDGLRDQDAVELLSADGGPYGSPLLALDEFGWAGFEALLVLGLMYE